MLKQEKFYVFYKPSGEIELCGNMPVEQPFPEPFPGTTLLETPFICWPFDWRIVDGAPAERPTLIGFDKLAITADGIDTATLALGEPFTATIDGVSHEISDGVLEIASEMPATYRVVIRHWPYRDFEAEIVAS